MTLIEFDESSTNRPQQPPINAVSAPEASQDDFDIPLIQPQGTTRRPIVAGQAFDHQVVPSLADLATTTPKPSPLLQESFQTVPGTNQGP